MKQFIPFLLLLPFLTFAQGYTSYFTGNTTNITTVTTAGTCLMGGATEHDNAMKWLLQRANGGDVVVLRSSGSNGYNNYLYSELGINVNSVETLVITSAAGATNPYVLEKVANAEMIWFAGGDQWNYVSYFKNNALETMINNHVNVKHAPIGGTSAGMAILGSEYFSAQNGSVTTAQALNNPYHANITLGLQDFLQVPYLNNVITDSHYDNPDRRGRHVAFMARLTDDLSFQMRGIGCNEYVAVCIDENGLAKVYGDYPAYDEFAYFIQPNCAYAISGVETCTPGTPLTWNHGGQALKVYKVPGTMNGTNTFDLSQWQNGIGSGGIWEHWSVLNGVLTVTPGTQLLECMLGVEDVSAAKITATPNPFKDHIEINVTDANVQIFDVTGKQVHSTGSNNGTVDTSWLAKGMYFVKMMKDGTTTTFKMVKE